MGEVSLVTCTLGAVIFIHVIILFCNIFSIYYDLRGSPNIEMDEHTFLVNRERAVDYLNSLDKVPLIL